ncbi:MAG TPA: HAMP domain-containing sensor histidine kinase [Vicinamibacterales bacterium]|nr:HAMP domain-containing sensor histidine kinase [Vicinamibacterales bacterium]
MQLRPRVAVTSLLIAVPAALLLFVSINSMRTADLTLTLERVVKSQINDQVRERCESDPRWFLTGSLEGRPKQGERPSADPDVMAPRPKIDEQPFELFAFDEEFLGSSPAAPRFPNELRFALRQSSQPATAPFPTKDGTGLQVAAWTGWLTGPCAVFLGRLRPEPHAMLRQFELFGGLFLVCYAVALLAVTPTVMRVRRLASDARQAVGEQFASIAPDRKKDELSSIAFIYNDTAKEFHLRSAESKDRDEALRRVVEDTSSTTRSLPGIVAKLGALETRESMSPGVRTELRQAVRDAHDLNARLNNLALAAELHARRGPFVRETVDLAPIVAGVVARLDPLARGMDVTLQKSAPVAPVFVAADRAKLDVAIGNFVDNAIRYNRAGGHVTIALTTAGGGQFSLKIRDNGSGVSEEDFKSLTAIRRFRGDEGRDRRPGVPGLGLAVAREVVERLGWHLDLGRPAAGGLEIEVRGTTSPAPSAGPR